MSEKITKKVAKKTAKKTTKKATKAKASGEPKAKVVKKKRLTKAEREANEEIERLKEKWNELHDLSEGQASKKYKLSEEYEPNSALQHPKLGWGYVLTSQNNRIEVLFEDGIKVLISNYKG